ncbi:hypothetical protein D1007_18615 [Hordeum vulgare]|nr:hypothetical protein D1007_18615 [Hordeum vulgare]
MCCSSTMYPSGSESRPSTTSSSCSQSTSTSSSLSSCSGSERARRLLVAVVAEDVLVWVRWEEAKGEAEETRRERWWRSQRMRERARPPIYRCLFRGWAGALGGGGVVRRRRGRRGCEATGLRGWAGVLKREAGPVGRDMCEDTMRWVRVSLMKAISLTTYLSR